MCVHVNVFGKASVRCDASSVKVLAEEELATSAEEAFVALFPSTTNNWVFWLDMVLIMLTVVALSATHLSPIVNSVTAEPIWSTTPYISCPGISWNIVC